ncbi:DUF4198 domain-containing protein [Wenxinia saemankumensis]|uniref:Uncharacterized conserved protein, contains GH25 family domain n=1 Tax=Wenxinia saemankumensis TaxID=1447782 RepID=A0A1M6A576_9RHOB|nr:DUF4198 domain-containing protein [Wenxinia saemankumensis]SHI31333.1 Uncharacterized conserved protein, contains GH25 family domain [Wenxinia saemankumensis]
MPFPAFRLCAVVLLVPLPAQAHEFWIEARDWQPPAEGMLEADLVNGEGFAGTRLPFLPRNTERLDMIRGEAGAPAPLRARIGDIPAIASAEAGDGLIVLAYVSTPTALTYSEHAVFDRFVAHKDLLGGPEAIAALEEERGLPDEPVTELYTRYSKALIGAGDAAGTDTRLGLETEIVALENPYTGDMADGIDVQLWYAGKVRADARIEVFARTGDETAEPVYLRTDADGIATVPVERGTTYMLDAVVLRVPAEGIAQDWESLWANLTFAVPAD